MPTVCPLAFLLGHAKNGAAQSVLATLFALSSVITEYLVGVQNVPALTAHETVDFCAAYHY